VTCNGVKTCKIGTIIKNQGEIMSKVAIVTDSTSYIPRELREKYPITVVPQVVIWENESFEDDVTITPEQFYTRLKTAKVMPSTSQASVVNMHKAFRSLIDQGYDVLGLFVSSKLSGTYQSAVLGREQLTSGKDKVEILDSETTAMAMGFQALTAARAALDGASIADCKALAEKARAYTGIYLTVDTLEFLHRGGRIGGAQRFLGTALNLKPILTVEAGRVEPVERVRTRRKALDRVVEIVAEKCAGKSPVHMATLHANSQEDAKYMLDQITPLVNPVESVFAAVSPAVGANTGPGTVGLAFMAGM
jgi:DegV family protein with EDD domain